MNRSIIFSSESSNKCLAERTRNHVLQFWKLH